MDHHRATTGIGAVLATFIWVVACTHSGQPQPDAQQSGQPQPDAQSSADTASLDVVASGSCLYPWQWQFDAPPATFEVTGCQWHTLDGGKTLAVFTWTNRTGQEQATPYGPANHVSPGADAQGQPTRFPFPGGSRFAVPFDGSLATWSILGQSVTVSQASPDCGSACESYDQPGCIDCVGHWVDRCTVACGDGVCDDGESCGTCPADCACSALVPLVDCVIPLDGGKKLVSFGYNNGGSTEGGLEIGPDNQFLSGQPARGQPVHFQVGEHHSVFQVTYGGPDVTWMLAGNALTVPPDAPLCSQNCGSCPQGSICVADQCRGSCGDGLCVEGCNDCPDDCACPAPEVCCGGCYNPSYCAHDGVGMECGTDDTCGFHVDCGPCPDGQACLDHFCEPICLTQSGVPVPGP